MFIKDLIEQYKTISGVSDAPTQHGVGYTAGLETMLVEFLDKKENRTDIPLKFGDFVNFVADLYEPNPDDRDFTSVLGIPYGLTRALDEIKDRAKRQSFTELMKLWQSNPSATKNRPRPLSSAEEMRFVSDVLRKKSEKASKKATDEGSKQKSPFKFVVLDRSAQTGDELATFLAELASAPCTKADRIQVLYRAPTPASYHWSVLDVQLNPESAPKICLVDAANSLPYVISCVDLIAKTLPTAMMTYVTSFSQKDGSSCLYYALDQASYLRKLPDLHEELSKSAVPQKNLEVMMGLFVQAPERNDFNRKLQRLGGSTLDSVELHASLNNIPVFTPFNREYSQVMPASLVGLCRDTQSLQEMQSSPFYDKHRMVDSGKTVAEYLEGKTGVIAGRGSEPPTLRSYAIYGKAEKYRHLIDDMRLERK